MPKKKKFVLTPENYYSSDRPHISVSMINAYIQSPELYYRRYVEKSLKSDPTPSMKLGTVVDSLIFNTDLPEDMDTEKFRKGAIFAKGQEMASKLISCRFWEEYNSPNYQMILEGEYKKMLLCGKPDIVDLGKDKAVYIDDLKTAQWNKCKDEQSWFWTCKKMGYFRQLAFYNSLAAQGVEEMTGGLTDYEVFNRHIVISEMEKGLYVVKLFVIDQALIHAAFEEIREALDNLKKEDWEKRKKEWSPSSWKDCSKISYPNLSDGVSPMSEYESDNEEQTDN